MNSIQDPTKKTSINSLLNPEASSAAAFNQISNLTPLSPNQVQTHGPQMNPYASGPYENAATFHLRAADWGNDKRKVETGATGAQRHFTHPSIDSSEIYVEGQPPRLDRPPPDEGNSIFHSIADDVWQTPMPYGAPVIGPLYSDERTGR
jgi:[histone H3]-dimethyl-L-lysine9 demethylase